MNGFESTTAVIMAGGKGTRLRPFTAVLPKPLVPIGDMSILEILLRRLSAYGFGRIVISTGYLSGLIQAVAGDGEKFGLSIEYCNEDSPLGTAGALGQIEGLEGPCIVMNGDLLTDMDFSALISHHYESCADVTIAAHKRSVKIDFGVVEMKANGDFSSFSEKPTYDMHVSMGVNVLSSRALRSITSGQYLDMPDLILGVHEDGGKVSCFKSSGFWLDIGRIEDYAEAQETFKQNRSLFLREDR